MLSSSLLPSIGYLAVLAVGLVAGAPVTSTGDYTEPTTSAVPESAPASLAAPIVQLDSGSFTGTSLLGINRFLGIPFALPPVENLRFAQPVATKPYNGTYSATQYGPACPQQAIDLPILPAGAVTDAVDTVINTLFGAIFPYAEDCLSVNVVAPSSATATSKLPVVVWIFGGGFELGTTSMYDGGGFVSRSIALGAPAVYVSMNYRVSAFGFLASKEVKAAGVGNLGLQDQRLALRWVQKYISKFGGDPTKVTIWGESAGAISVASQMVTNGGNTEGLFRAGVMQSGSPLPVGDISHGQPDYDALVQLTGCSGTKDTLQCLREVPYAKLKMAVDASPGIFSYQSLRLTWLPRTDGVFFTDTPQNLVKKGSVAKIPYITGDCDDEGTLFSLSTLNITTDAQMQQYTRANYLPSGTVTEISKLLSLYPNDITQGSPFDTGVLNALSPQFKRMAAFVGDLVFQAPRRFFLDNTSGKQNTWSFLSKRAKAIPFLGSLHASDILNSYGNGELTDYIIRFANTLDPNNGAGNGIQWPKYDTTSRKVLTFLDGLIPQTISADTYRQDAMTYLTELSLKYPV